MTRLSRYFLPTEKQAPADAEATSHKLMVRAGLVRQVGAGLWSWLPAGWRVHRRVVAILREHIVAYDRIFDRCGLEWYRVESDVGMMGGLGAHEYMAPCAAGENEVALAPGFAANVEIASAQAAPVELPAPLASPEEVVTPGLTTVADVAGRLGAPSGALLKAFPVVTDGHGMVMVVVRGDHRVNDIKLRRALGAEFRPAREEEILAR